MTTVTRTCAKCGAKIFAEAPQEFCSACLLKTGLALLAEEVQTSNVQRPTSNAEFRGEGHAPKPARIGADFGDYELLEEIGRGGQGLVYRARQRSLNRIVALKVIGLGVWATQEHIKRFRVEAEAAASLDHPYIVPVYEIGERDGACYFSMKFVEGGQLDQVVKHEPMSIRHSAELIAKLARTVHYAHEHGVLHRDIKPENILLDAQGEPLLMDFGLARLVEADSTLTRTLEVMGTPGYMAPEQAAGETAKLTRTTDIYGLGAVLYRLLTGHPPFAGRTSYEITQLVLETEPRQPHLWNPKIDRELSTICLKCLEKDPQKRYPSALMLAEDLEHWLKHEPIQAKRSGFFTHARKWVRRKPAIAALIASLIALAAAMGWIVLKTEHTPPLVTNGIAVLPFENLSHDPDNAYFAEGIEEEILTRLASIAGLKVISRTSTQRYRSEARNLREIARELGVGNILEGSVQKAADQVRVNVQLINAQTDSPLWAESYDRRLNDILGIESEIAKRIAESLQANLTGREEQALALKPTNNPEAYDAYLRGLAFEARSRFSLVSIDLVWKAVGFYEQAVELDPNFALAWARLSRADALLYFNGEDTTPPTRRDVAKGALENAQKVQPDSPETLLALGYFQYWVLRDYGPAKNTFERISKLLPGSSEVPKALGYVARRQGNWDQSIAYFQQAVALDPRNVELLVDTASTYAFRRQFPKALKLYDRVLDITPNDPDVMAAKASIYQAEGNLEEAARFLSEINWQTPSEDTLAIKVGQLRLERNYGEAVRLLQLRQAQFQFASERVKRREQVVLAFTQRLAGDVVGAKATAEQACNSLKQLHRNQPENAFVAGPLSQAYATMGEKEPALKEAERAIILLPRSKDPVDGPALEENLAFIQMLFGENADAIAALTQLLQTSYNNTFFAPPIVVTPALLRLDPIWDPLRGDPAFQELCKDKQPPATP